MGPEPVLTEVLSAFAETVAEDFTTGEVLRQLAHAAVRALDVDGAGVMVPHGPALLRFAFAAGPAGPAVSALEELQDGPCGASHRRLQPISIADLAVEGDWPSYQQHAVRADLRAVTALPLLARGQSWGVLDLYRAEPRRLTASEPTTAQALGRVAASYLVITADRDAARQAQQELAHRAMHDPGTGLPVRWVFLEQLTHALSRLSRHPGRVGVLFADLDQLKYVNDTYGHDAGDRLLITCVERIRAALRPSDVVARVGGDEFVVLLEDLTDEVAASAVARRILTELAQPYRLDGQVLQPSASLGLALTDDPTLSAAALIAHANSAMYRAKRAGRGRYELFDAVVYAADRDRASLRNDTTIALRSAVHRGQLLLHYQPIVDLTAEPAALHAVEALLRWQHPTRGLLTAHDFVPDAEHAGLLPELGRWVLATACDQLAAWDAELGACSPARLFVNISAEELTDPRLPQQVAAILQRTGIAPGRLTLEVTETGVLVVNHTAAHGTLTALRELGCDLAIDDFGTGYSSLSRLVDLPAATWKIDRSFTSELSSRPAAAAVVSAALQLGATLHRTVVVEGVESDNALQTLRRLGCTHAQGYHLGRPQDADQLADQLSGGRAQPNDRIDG